VPNLSAPVDGPWVAPIESRRLKLAGLALLVGAGVSATFVVNHTLVEWPIPAGHLLLYAAVSVLGVNLFAAGLLVLAAGCGSTHALRNPGRRRAVVLQIVLANVLAPALLYGAIIDNPVAESALETRDWDVAGSIVAYALLFVAWRLWRCSRRYDAVGADEAMALDPRPPVLYLRSFHDDDIALIDDGGSAFTRHVMQAINPPSPEQEMADILRRVGPVVAIGKPGEPLPQLGAARLYVTNEQWQRKVTELMSVAGLVVVRLGASAGVLWEVEQALAHLPRQRLVLAVLGGSMVAPELVARLRLALGPSFEAALPQPAPRGWRTMLFKDPRRRIGGLVCFAADGSARSVPVRAWPIALRDVAYAAMLRPSAAPLRGAWRRLFADTGLSTITPARRSRAVAVLLAALLGWTGAQWFYLGHRRRGWLYAVALPLFVFTYFLSLVDALRFIWVDRKEFDARFVAARPAAVRA
jgi:TM2 domain-containing membrane protein YozV